MPEPVDSEVVGALCTLLRNWLGKTGVPINGLDEKSLRVDLQLAGQSFPLVPRRVIGEALALLRAEKGPP